MVHGVFVHLFGRGEAGIHHDSARFSLCRRHHGNPPSVGYSYASIDQD